MDIQQLKEYICDNNYIEQILTSIGCHHIKNHGEYFQCANKTGDNPTAIVVKNNQYLSCTNYTRQMIKENRKTDLLDLVCYTKEIDFFQAVKFISEEIGIDYYHDFNEDLPESLQITNLVLSMNTNEEIEEEKPVKPINEVILSYYYPHVNDLFYEDGINYTTQKEFEIGFDPISNRITIPIKSELGDLVGVKGRYFYREVPDDECKYIYLEPCSKSKIIYGLHKTLPYIKKLGKIYIGEAEKAVMQGWSYGDCNFGSIGGKKISSSQAYILMRLGVDICFVFDKDVTFDEIKTNAEMFPEGVNISYIWDKSNILSEKESPTDNYEKWQYLKKNCEFKYERDDVSND